MKQQITFIMLLFAAIATKAQTIEYSIDFITKDSFYLVEKVTEAKTPETQRPSVSLNQKLFTSITDIQGFVAALRNRASDEDKKAKEAQDISAALRRRAEVIEDVIVKSSSLFVDQPKK
jgi:hypothetical protein